MLKALAFPRPTWSYVGGERLGGLSGREVTEDSLAGNAQLSWKRFFEEGAEKFFAGTFAGAYQAELMREFDAALPEKAPWQK